MLTGSAGGALGAHRDAGAPPVCAQPTTSASTCGSCSTPRCSATTSTSGTSRRWTSSPRKREPACVAGSRAPGAVTSPARRGPARAPPALTCPGYCRYAEKQVGYVACSILLNEVRRSSRRSWRCQEPRSGRRQGAARTRTDIFYSYSGLISLHSLAAGLMYTVPPPPPAHPTPHTHAEGRVSAAGDQLCAQRPHLP